MAGRVFVAAGTRDGRELAGYILQQGYQVTASVVSSYGESLLNSYQGIQVSCEPLDEEGFIAYFHRHGIGVFVDASLCRQCFGECHEGMPQGRRGIYPL